MRLCILYGLIASLLCQQVAAETTVIRNVRGYTPAGGGVQSFRGLLIVDGKVQRLLQSDADVPQAPDATVIDGGGKTLLPGLTDAHGHVFGLGQERLQVDLRGSPTLADALARVQKFAAANPQQRWILGRGWNQVLWPKQQFPTAADLDSVLPDRPVVLARIDGHATWANSAALQIAGITAATADPPGGQIVRDAQGRPIGIFVDNAEALLERHIPKRTDADVKRALQTAMDELVSLGLTGVHDAGIDMQQYRAYQELGAAGKLPLRVYAMLADAPAHRDMIAASPPPPQFDERLQMRAVKAWVDGALGSRGAALLSDYSDQPQHRGLMLYTQAQLQALVKLTSTSGWQLNLHAIGDAGNRLALDAFEKLMTAQQRSALRPRIEHAQVIAPQDIPRFATLGVIASIQPTHATSDMNMAEDRIGAQRIKGAYAWRSLRNAGVQLAGGSDFPVELANPFHGLYAAVTRQDRDGRPPGGWYPQEKLTREEALRLFTIDAAYAARMEHATGSLEPGKWADFILIDRDYFGVPEAALDDIVVLATYVAGKQVAPRVDER